MLQQEYLFYYKDDTVSWTVRFIVIIQNSGTYQLLDLFLLCICWCHVPWIRTGNRFLHPYLDSQVLQDNQQHHGQVLYSGNIPLKIKITLHAFFIDRSHGKTAFRGDITKEFIYFYNLIIIWSQQGFTRPLFLLAETLRVLSDYASLVLRFEDKKTSFCEWHSMTWKP